MTKKRVMVLGTAILFLAVGVFVYGNSAMRTAPNLIYKKEVNTSATEQQKEVVVATHINTPDAVKAVYMSQCAASTPSFREHFLSLLDETELNSIIIDVKDYTGTIAFPTEVSDPAEGKGCEVRDMEELVELFHDRGVYVIARITVFQDPLYTSKYPHQAVQSKARTGEPWEDHKGLSFVDVGAKPFWEYIVAIAKASHAIGFDELNFDYIRYPSDGPMSDAVYTHSNEYKKQEELERFFAYLAKNVRVADAAGNVPKLSADLFGMTTTNQDDLSIGQVLERATPYFDYIAPMVYPSHYPSGFNGYANPNTEVYGVIKFSMDAAVERVMATSTPIASFAYEQIMTTPAQNPASTSTPAAPQPTGMYSKPSRDKDILRPWLQDFDYGGNYGVEEVRAQIMAAYDAGLDSWMLWDPANRYTKEALLPN